MLSEKQRKHRQSSRGGRAAAQRMTPEQRTARARKAALARWGSKEVPEPEARSTGDTQYPFRTLEDFRNMLRAATVQAQEATN